MEADGSSASAEKVRKLLFLGIVRRSDVPMIENQSYASHRRRSVCQPSETEFRLPFEARHSDFGTIREIGAKSEIIGRSEPAIGPCRISKPAET